MTTITEAAQILKGSKHGYEPQEHKGLVRATCLCGWRMYTARRRASVAADDWDMHVLIDESSDGVGGTRDRLTKHAALKGKRTQ